MVFSSILSHLCRLSAKTSSALLRAVTKCNEIAHYSITMHVSQSTSYKLKVFPSLPPQPPYPATLIPHLIFILAFFFLLIQARVSIRWVVLAFLVYWIASSVYGSICFIQGYFSKNFSRRSLYSKKQSVYETNEGSISLTSWKQSNNVGISMKAISDFIIKLVLSTLDYTCHWFKSSPTIIKHTSFCWPKPIFLFSYKIKIQ